MKQGTREEGFERRGMGIGGWWRRDKRVQPPREGIPVESGSTCGGDGHQDRKRAR